MMSPDHPNAVLLARHYEAMASAIDTEGLDDEARRSAYEEVARQVAALLAPDFVIHTCGIRLAATGGRELTMAMGQRRNSLCGNTFRPVSGLTIIADDTYAVVRGVFEAEHGGRRYRHEGMGTWLFNDDGQAIEHWEHAPGQLWDDFFIGCDPDFAFSSGEEFWHRGTA